MSAGNVRLASSALTVAAAHVILVEFTLPYFQPAPMVESGDPVKLTTEYAIHAVSFIVFAIVWKLFVSPRGPLEGVIASLVKAVSPKRPEREESREGSGGV